MPGGGAAVATYQKKEPAAAPGPPGPPFQLTSAENGLSVDPTDFRIVLGQEIGEVGDPAQLLDNREIPMDGFFINFTDISANGTAGLIFEAGAGKPFSTPFFLFRDELSDEIGRINFLSDIDVGGDGGSVYMGRLAGSSDTFPNGNNVAVGWRALELMDTGFANVAIGYEGMFNLTSGTNNTSMGASVLGNLLDGGSHTSVGSNSGQNLVSGVNNSFFGAFSSQGFYGASSNNAVFGSSALMIGAPSPDVSGNSILGALNFVDGGSQFGNENIVIGFDNDQHAGVINENNIIMGWHNFVDGGVTNSFIFGNGFVSTLSNVIILGDDTQNTLIGQPVAAPVDAGERLQVIGNARFFDSADPLNGVVITPDANIVIAGNIAGGTTPRITLTDSTPGNSFRIEKLVDRSCLGMVGGAINRLITFDASQNFRVGLITDADAGQTLQVGGDFSTDAPVVGTAGAWKFGNFEAGAVVATGGIRVNIGGTDYKIPAVAA